MLVESGPGTHLPDLQAGIATAPQEDTAIQRVRRRKKLPLTRYAEGRIVLVCEHPLEDLTPERRQSYLESLASATRSTIKELDQEEAERRERLKTSGIKIDHLGTGYYGQKE